MGGLICLIDSFRVLVFPPGWLKLQVRIPLWDTRFALITQSPVWWDQASPASLSKSVMSSMLKLCSLKVALGSVA